MSFVTLKNASTQVPIDMRLLHALAVAFVKRAALSETEIFTKLQSYRDSRSSGRHRYAVSVVPMPVVLRERDCCCGAGD